VPSDFSAMYVYFENEKDMKHDATEIHALRSLATNCEVL
jgi:hypothetical protein